MSRDLVPRAAPSRGNSALGPAVLAATARAGFASLLGRGLMLACALLGVLACAGGPPPASQFPSARAAIERMRASHACSRAIVGEGKIDYFGSEGRLRVNTLYVAARPESVRFDVFSPFGASLSTLTADGRDFTLSDSVNRVFFHGPANQCNVSRFLRVPVPPHALAQLLMGEAPVLVHQAEAASLAWQAGRYVLNIRGDHDASQVIDLVPHGADFAKPWQEQRVRVLAVAVEQQNIELFRAEFLGHRSVPTAKPRIDPDGLEPPIMPSGPSCAAEVPERIRFQVPLTDQDLELTNKEVSHNPPLTAQSFEQEPSRGLKRVFAHCDSAVWSGK